MSLLFKPPSPTGNTANLDEALDLFQKESEDPTGNVVVVANSDKDGLDVDFEPSAQTIKPTTEALRLIDDLKEIASTTLKDEILESKLSALVSALRIHRFLFLLSACPPKP